MGREVVEHDVDVEVPSNVQVDELEEGEDVGRLVGLLRIEEHLAGSEIHGRKQIGGAVPLVVMVQQSDPARASSAATVGCDRGPGPGSSHRN